MTTTVIPYSTVKWVIGIMSLHAYHCYITRTGVAYPEYGPHPGGLCTCRIDHQEMSWGMGSHIPRIPPIPTSRTMRHFHPHLHQPLVWDNNDDHDNTHGHGNDDDDIQLFNSIAHVKSVTLHTFHRTKTIDSCGVGMLFESTIWGSISYCHPILYNIGICSMISSSLYFIPILFLFVHVIMISL